MKEMEAKKEQDEANQVEGREEFDYTVSRRRKKVSPPPPVVEAPPSEPDKQAVDKEVIEWIKDHVESSVKMCSTQSQRPVLKTFCSR